MHFFDNEYLSAYYFSFISACSEGYNSNLYPQFEQINTQANEQANAGIKRLKGFISYMNQENFMKHLTLYLWQRNQDKLKNLNGHNC